MYVDERNVPHDHPDSTHKAVREALLSKTSIPTENVLAIAENVPVDQVGAMHSRSACASYASHEGSPLAPTP